MDKRMPTMYILRGIPASGKSTWRTNMNLAYINRDTLRLENPNASEKEITQLQNDFVRNSMQSGIDFIIDNTHVRPKSYQQYIVEASNYGYAVEVVEFRTPFIECIQNNLKRARQVPESIIFKMAHDIGWYEEELKVYFGAQKEKRKAIIVDLDGTLCDITHRRQWVIEKPKNWKMFFAGIAEDKVNRAVASIIERYNCSYDTDVILVSGRGEEHREETGKWLRKHKIVYNLLLMRPYNNREDDDIIKESIYRTYIEPYFNVLFCIDDRVRIIRMWRKLGLTCFAIQEEEF